MVPSVYRVFFCLLTCFLVCYGTWRVEAGTALLVEPAHVLAVYPHDPTSFTEGLSFQNGFLYESTGLEGRSVIRRVILKTGKVLLERGLQPGQFGEGIAVWKNRLISLTWHGGTGFIWSFPGLNRIGIFHYQGEGWGLTHDAKDIIMSNGSSCLAFMDPDRLVMRHRLCVTANGIPVTRLNELEYVHGEILANIWMTPKIARIDPATGKVKGWIDLAALEEKIGTTDSEAVSNGIAFDQRHDALFVTGKYWNKIYRIALPGGMQ